LSQRRAPFTVRPMPGTNTASNNAKQASSNSWFFDSMTFSSVRIIHSARPTPPARKIRWRVRK
jgi:hypothetical protein